MDKPLKTEQIIPCEEVSYIDYKSKACPLVNQCSPVVKNRPKNPSQHDRNKSQNPSAMVEITPPPRPSKHRRANLGDLLNSTKRVKITSPKSQIYSFAKRIIEQDQTPPSRFVLNESEVSIVCSTVVNVLNQFPNLVQVKSPSIVVGDIHGQFEDLLQILRHLDSIDSYHYVFLGDFVDRGNKGLECLTLLYCLQLLFPKAITLLRGNHETVSINEAFGFLDECVQRFSVRGFQSLTKVYDYLPVAGLIDNSILCLHGGIGPSLKNLSQIDELVRPLSEAYEGIQCDLMWADPNSRSSISEFKINNERGVSYLFPKKKLNDFLRNNKLSMIVRGHEVMQKGWSQQFDNRVMTVFSAPNYGGFGNIAAVLLVEKGLKRTIITFPSVFGTGDKNNGGGKIANL